MEATLQLQCVDLLQWFLLLWNMGSRAWASVVVADGLSSAVACGIFPDQGWNPCLLQWQGGSPVSLHFDLRTSLSISYTASLLEMISFSFCISENNFILPLFLKIISTEYRILADSSFPL